MENIFFILIVPDLPFEYIITFDTICVLYDWKHVEERSLTFSNEGNRLRKYLFKIY